MPDLPAPLQEIKDVDTSLPLPPTRPVRHGIEFASESGHQLATFASDGPLYFPAVGQRIKIHEVEVVVTSLSVSYETDEDGAPAVFAMATVVPAEGE
ncbi:hypothetical protein [Streptomyces achromogenes]|uniref:hypothetical protein n=1 Tax=Streptomyces achromogenes TaxID=67255 RepID=UPI0036931D4A